MRPFRLLPRLLLCLLLVVDGVWGAVAAAHVHPAAAVATAARAAATPAAAIDTCSDHGTMAPGAGAADGDGASDPGTDHGQDCCSDAGATCACPGSNVSAIPVGGAMPRAGLPAALAVHPLLPGHAAPRLPGPMRPPIA